MKVLDMTQRYRKFKRSWGMWYAFDTVTGNSVSFKTRVKSEAVQKVNAMNEIERQPSISLGLAKVYLNATDPKLATRTECRDQIGNRVDGAIVELIVIRISTYFIRIAAHFHSPTNSDMLNIASGVSERLERYKKHPIRGPFSDIDNDPKQLFRL